MAFGYYNLLSEVYLGFNIDFRNALISYKIMMKNDHFYWKKWLGPQQALHSG